MGCEHRPANASFSLPFSLPLSRPPAHLLSPFLHISRSRDGIIFFYKKKKNEPYVYVHVFSHRMVLKVDSSFFLGGAGGQRQHDGQNKNFPGCLYLIS